MNLDDLVIDKVKRTTGWQFRCSCGATFDGPTDICPVCGNLLNIFKWDEVNI